MERVPLNIDISPGGDGSLGELSIPPGCGEFWIVPVQRVATTERDSFLVCRGIGLPLPEKAVEAVHRRLRDGFHLFISDVRDLWLAAADLAGLTRMQAFDGTIAKRQSDQRLGFHRKFGI